MTKSSAGTPAPWPGWTRSSTYRAAREEGCTTTPSSRTADPPHTGRVRPVTLPAVELAVTMHVGVHDDIDVTYGELGAWVVGNALVVAGPVRETYLVGPRDTPDRRPGGPR